MSNQISSVFQNIGLLSVYIINESGIPLLTRYYDGTQSTDQGNIMIAGFLGAISLFAQSELISYISDIGIYRKRLLFKYQAGFIYIMVFYENKLTSLTLQQFHELIEVIIWRLTSEFRSFYDKKKTEVNFFELSKEIENYGPKADVLLEQGCLEWQKTLDAQTPQLIETIDEIDETNNNLGLGFDPLIKRFGIQGIFVIDRTNSPIYTRIYNTDNVLIANENIMTAFFTAINSFIQNTLVSEVSDVGMFNQRILVKQHFPYTFIVVIDALVHLNTSRGEGRSVIDSFIKDLNQDIKNAINTKKVDFSVPETIDSFNFITDQLFIKLLTEYELNIKQSLEKEKFNFIESTGNDHPLYQDFSSIIEDISKYFTEIKDGGSGDVKLKVKIRNKLSNSKLALKDAVSKLENDFDLVTSISYDAIARLNDILSSVTLSGSILEFWFELNAFSNELLLLVIDLYNKEKLAKFTIHSARIMTILGNVPIIADFPNLIDISIDNTQNREKWMTVFNSLQLCANVFYIVGNPLLNLSKDDLSKYISAGFCHSKLLMTMYQSFDWQQMASYENKPAERFFISVKDKLYTYFNLYDKIVRVYKRVDPSVLTKMEKHDFVKDLSIEQLIVLNNEFRTLCLESKSKLEDLYQNGTFDYNDNPKNSPSIYEIDIVIKKYNLYEAYFEAMNVGLEKTTSESDTKAIVGKINRAYELALWYQEFLEHQVGDKKKLAKSAIIDEYIKNLIMIIEILALNAYWTNNDQI